MNTLATPTLLPPVCELFGPEAIARFSKTLAASAGLLDPVVLDNPLLGITKEEAGRLSRDDARALLGHWWTGSTGYFKLDSEEGRQQLHRTWLRYTYANRPEEIPLSVLLSHAIGKPAFNTR
jgi:hypothetical protein